MTPTKNSINSTKSMISILLVFLLLSLTACSSRANSNQVSVQPPTSSEKELQELSIMLDWYPNAVHSFLYSAQKNGYFAKQGLEVNIQMPAETNDSLKLVAAGKVDLALSYQPQVLMARGENIPVKSIAAIVRHPLNHLMVPVGGKVKSPKDLIGANVGYSSIPLYEAMVHTMIKNDGGASENVNMIDVGYDLIPAIATSKVDAIMGGFINHEQLILAKQGHPMVSLNPTEYGVPDYYELVLVASDQGLKDKTELLTKFVTAIREGQQYVQQHPDQALSVLFEHEDQTSPLDKEIETKSLQILLPLMDAMDQPFGYQAPVSWENVNQWLMTNKLLSNSINTNDAFINL
ncbi:ABC transporter substrate-binding protein [Paenibacillus macquariensis]|uniref:Hydroxymethylpyrimidine transport system substrate-binding protein n=1 Tax=Paenibacillus macquariensis TaxID=948756 RepID=A0ABY1JWN2_9BACL|nr:ABC transporter substrate-binding protein [Paenibacillus macquariensis]MEC0089445.1 ABC transporter substrate-binding protein [Paenibacillus macquariensis]SIQ91217.1 putative hydroxymethylpyrimidine transport system substrate-binding protein [Paenibacillus macquariensis]